MKRFKIPLMILAVLFGLLIVKNFVIKSVVTGVASDVLGAPVSIRSLSVGLFSQKVEIRDMKIYNPPGFSTRRLI